MQDMTIVKIMTRMKWHEQDKLHHTPEQRETAGVVSDLLQPLVSNSED
jgi:hypothetical protein